MGYIYRLYNKDNELLYVGQTKNLKYRINQHKKNQLWWNEVDWIEYAIINQKHLINVYEIYYINKGTKYNIRDTKIIYKKFKFPELFFLKYFCEMM